MKPLLVALGLLASSTSFAEFAIENIKPGETVRYPLLILSGTADGNEMAAGTSWKDAVRFPVMNHRFVATVQLKPGKNMLLLHAGAETMKFRVDYAPASSPFKVLAVFVTSANQDKTYYTTDPKDKFQIPQKMDLAFKLMQSVTAELMNQAGEGRKTFGLELDSAGKVVVHFIKSPLSTEQIGKMDAQTIYGQINDQLNKEFPSPYVKWCGLLGFASYDPTQKRSIGHLALGGDRQALFGAASMQWWPAALKELPKALANTAAIDPQKTFEDSGNRGTVWANISTALGACLHEIGHTFDLPHSADRFSIMSRGFDYFGRQLMPMEAPLKPGAWTAFPPTERPKWEPSFSAQLALSKWFQPELPTTTEDDKPKIVFENGSLAVSAPAGIRYVGAHNDGLTDWFSVYSPKDAQKTMKISVAEIQEQMHSEKLLLTFVVIDGNGNRSSIEVKA